MVFMVYTIMLLDDRDASYQRVFSPLAVPALAMSVLAGVALCVLLGGSPPTTPAAAAAGEGPFTFAAFSVEFMRHYWFHFELATVLLLIGIVAAWTAIREGR
jgi:NADH:ubiquinone oxidoreductase subunit 6 (subunit J)